MACIILLLLKTNVSLKLFYICIKDLILKQTFFLHTCLSIVSINLPNNLMRDRLRGGKTDHPLTCIMYIASWIGSRLDGGLCVAKHESAHHRIQWKSATSCVMERRYRLEPGLWLGDRLSYGLAASIRADTRAQPSLGSFRSFSIRRKFSRPGSCEIHQLESLNT